MKRVRAAEKAREEWEDRYEVVRCREYWAGKQRDDPEDSSQERKAQVNLILPTLRSRIPSLYFYYPFARVVASPAKSDTPAETVDNKAQLIVAKNRSGMTGVSRLRFDPRHIRFHELESA